jgi:hypothetical protein
MQVAEKLDWKGLILGSYVVQAVRLGMKLYNDQCNAQVFKLFLYLLLPYMFQAFF